MFNVVERHRPRRCRFEFQRTLSRHRIQEPRDEALTMQYLGSTVVVGADARFCQFDGPSETAVAVANQRAGLPFHPIVPALTVRPTKGEPMNITTSIRPTIQIRRSHLFGVVLAVAALTAATTWAAGVAIDTSPEPAETRAPTSETVLAGLGPNQRQYVEAIMAMTPAQLVATFGTAPVDHRSPNQRHLDDRVTRTASGWS